MQEIPKNGGSIVTSTTAEERAKAEERIRAEVAEILGPDNKWFAGERVRHPPTRRDCFEQWRRGGGRKRFVATHTLAA